MASRKGIYAVYKGENFLFDGTIKYIAERLNVKVCTVWNYTKPWHKKRYEGCNATFVVKIGSASELEEYLIDKQNVYEFYIGHEFIMTGTANEIAEYKGTDVNNVYAIAGKGFSKNFSNRKHRIIKIGTTDEMEEYNYGK